jgi:hypothetical protein
VSHSPVPVRNPRQKATLASAGSAANFIRELAMSACRAPRPCPPTYLPRNCLCMILFRLDPLNNMYDCSASPVFFVFVFVFIFSTPTLTVFKRDTDTNF